MWSYWYRNGPASPPSAIAVAGALAYVIPAAGSGIGLVIVAHRLDCHPDRSMSRGARSAGGLQLVTTLIKIVPLLAVDVLVAHSCSASGTADSSRSTPMPISIGRDRRPPPR